MNRIAGEVLTDNFTTDLLRTFQRICRELFDRPICLPLALMLVYLILSAQFESFIDPIIIISIVPLACQVLSLLFGGQILP
ncbi:MAG: efflux RND transporter permease subunit [Saprospiraceae bacterium]|nr:efflux RND transporter permease subunit [Saprospiraceae bacterium]